MSVAPVTIVIPTFRREAVLVETVRALLALPAPAAELIVADQTPSHEPQTENALRKLAEAGRIRWLRLAQPSIPAAMNAGLLAATQERVLFLDDDIVPEPDLVTAHWAAHQKDPRALVAGRVLQPWDEGRDHSRAEPFHFATLRERWIVEFMGGNFSVGREDALALGGFDENFVRVAYRFEAEFAHRWRADGRRIFFAPGACIHHLKAGDGGTRTFGHHLTTWRSDHAVGAYYWALRTRSWREFSVRPVRSVATRFHLRRPWRIPHTAIAELGGMLWALRLYAHGPRLIAPGAGNP
jgi:GT2 family glycosyltransferase